MVGKTSTSSAMAVVRTPHEAGLEGTWIISGTRTTRSKFDFFSHSPCLHNPAQRQSTRVNLPPRAPLQRGGLQRTLPGGSPARTINARTLGRIQPRCQQQSCVYMVCVKQDDGVVGHLRLVQRLDDITHVLVHV